LVVATSNQKVLTCFGDHRLIMNDCIWRDSHIRFFSLDDGVLTQ
jgi:hypothetical protein